MNLFWWRGCISSIIIYVLIFFFFPIVFGNTPLNLLNLGSRNGASNFLINIISFGFIVIIIAFISSVFITNKKSWLKGNLIGTVIDITFFLIISPIYMVIFF
ncbi:hypothetical protein JOC75_001032 [Metabacillus crassostreae]|nr:hypothetical protein [Metabacillus crassostreae]